MAGTATATTPMRETTSKHPSFVSPCAKAAWASRCAAHGAVTAPRDPCANDATTGVPADGAVAATVYLTQFERFHERLFRVIGERLPAGTGWVGVTALPRDALVQMDFVIRLD